MTWLGIDDTDSRSGGCTTHVMTEVIAGALAQGFDLIGEPRLVRLNPNVPYKTRGNAALAARFGHGLGAPRTAGALPTGPVRSFPRARALTPAERTVLLDTAWATVLASARTGEAGVDPALVAAERPLPAAFYWKAVHRWVGEEEARAALSARGASVRHTGSTRGIVGAAAAVAWPGHHPTWELLSYRDPARVGTRRRVEAGSVRHAEAAHPELFLCTDRRTRRVLVAPHTDCPILFGLRATEPGPLPKALATIRSEPWERWVLFRTNQGTGDHLARLGFHELTPYAGAILEGTVAATASVRAGGHRAFPLEDRAGRRVECWAFEPTKTLPGVAARLAAGDRVRVWGGVTTRGALNLEGIEVLRVAPRTTPTPNPRCPRCGRRMDSAGAGRGFRCPRDGARRPPEARGRSVRPPTLAPGRYHPTPSARRHLAPRASEGGRGGETEVTWWRRRGAGPRG